MGSRDQEVKPFATFRNSFGANRKSFSTRRTQPCSTDTGLRFRTKKSTQKRVNSCDSGDSARGSRVNPVGKHWLTKSAVIIRRDGKEICNPATPEGRAEYKWRTICMWVRQYDPTVGYSRCCNCGEPLELEECSFEHEDGRAAGKRDDRLAIFDDEGRFLRHINGVSHLTCNSQRGSTRTPIVHGNNALFEIPGSRLEESA